MRILMWFTAFLLSGIFPSAPEEVELAVIGTLMGIGIAASVGSQIAGGVLAAKGASAQARAAERASAVGISSGGFFRRGFDSPDLRDADRFERLVRSQLAQQSAKEEPGR